MKRKRFDRRNWQRVVGGGDQTTLALPGGLIVDYRAVEVITPLEVPFAGRTLRILDSGYRWVSYVPFKARHALTVQLDALGHLQQLYVDVGETTGIDDDGLPWIDDLYLDVVGVATPSAESWMVSETEVLDEDELDDALRLGRVTPPQYQIAWAEARAVLAALETQQFAPLDVVRRYLQDPYT
ncbi:DUF402 domain-containing protein [Deinococcus sp.]|uniref:DUF402 domain-containing protein n=1 Tax=Deinococcus sp. TaxID=47478 RepID=UPI003B5A148F